MNGDTNNKRLVVYLDMLPKSQTENRSVPCQRHVNEEITYNDTCFDVPPIGSEVSVVDEMSSDHSDFNDSESSNQSSTSENESYSHEQCKKEIRIECLETFESLQQKGRAQGLKIFDYVYPGKVYEVDLIFANKLIEDETYYYVKWKNYSSDSNTWEPECHLRESQETIKYYHAMRNPRSKLNRSLLQYFVNDLVTRKPYDILTLTKVCAVAFECSEGYVNSLQLTIPQMKQKVREILSFHHSRINRISKKLLHIMQFGESRKRVLINLQEWEYEINSKNEAAYIKVENHVDLETAPAGFQFIHDYINTTLNTPEEPVAFCRCLDCYLNKECCCPHDSDGHFAYNKHRRLMLEPGYPIYECNKRCRCARDCVNRVVQHGQKVKVCIFRTSNGCGWGLKALDPIEKGQFVLEYLGEIITSEAAENRGKIYDYIGRSYLFDLDYGESFCCYTVDAGHVGNAAHFINHSCDPNLHVFAVWINQPNPQLPRLAFFAKRKIKRGEELTFDYKMVQKNRFGPQSPMREEERILCRCNSKNCRKFLF